MRPDALYCVAGLGVGAVTTVVFTGWVLCGAETRQKGFLFGSSSEMAFCFIVAGVLAPAESG